MAGLSRTNVGRRPRGVGTTVGMEVSTFGLDKLQAGINGETIAPILVEAIQPALLEAREAWPVLTGASLSTMVAGVSEIGPHHARVVLQVGGEALITHPDNKSKKDYAPYIEFNGSPTGRGQHSISNAIYGNDKQMRQTIKNGIKALFAEVLS